MSMYTINYTNNCGGMYIVLNNWEDAERIAQFIADMYGDCELSDGEYSTKFVRKDDSN